MSYTSINVHDVVSIVFKPHDLSPEFSFAVVSFTDKDGNLVTVTAFSATDSPIPIEGATLTDEVPV